jgi:FixJ family two-component response regulator
MNPLTRPITVALVDNDPSMLRALHRLLVAQGFHVESYPSAEAFLDRNLAASVDCLILDINLDGMSGIALRRKMAASGSDVPVVFMTAFDSESTQQEATNVGCVAYLLKPFPAASLLGAIEKAAA